MAQSFRSFRGQWNQEDHGYKARQPMKVRLVPPKPKQQKKLISKKVQKLQSLEDRIQQQLIAAEVHDDDQKDQNPERYNDEEKPLVEELTERVRKRKDDDLLALPLKTQLVQMWAKQQYKQLKETIQSIERDVDYQDESVVGDNELGDEKFYYNADHKPVHVDCKYHRGDEQELSIKLANMKNNLAQLNEKYGKEVLEQEIQQEAESDIDGEEMSEGQVSNDANDDSEETDPENFTTQQEQLQPPPPKPVDIKHFGGFISHGEAPSDRNHMPDFKYENKLDPPLTPQGMKQSRATGEFLKKHFEDNDLKFDRYIIECSPFLRCMMTAAQIAEVLGVENVTINYRATEEQKQQVMDEQIENPLPKLEFCKYKFNFKRMREENALYQKAEMFPSSINFKEPFGSTDYKTEVFHNYPDSLKEGQVKGVSLLEAIVQRFDLGQGLKYCYLIISHGMYIDECAHILQWIQDKKFDSQIFTNLQFEQRAKLMQTIYKTSYAQPDFCSISAFQQSRSKGVVSSFSRHTNHVKDLLRSKQLQLNPGTTQSGQAPSVKVKTIWKKNMLTTAPKLMKNEINPVLMKKRKVSGQSGQKALVVQAISSGFEGTNIATIKMDNFPCKVQSNERGDFRGLHIVVINPTTGKVVSAKVFDTHVTSDEFESFIQFFQKGILDDHIVVSACKDDCATKLSWDIKKWFEGMGSQEIWNLKPKQAFAFIGTFGKQECNEKRSENLKEEIEVTQIFMVDAEESSESDNSSEQNKSVLKTFKLMKAKQVNQGYRTKIVMQPRFGLLTPNEQIEADMIKDKMKFLTPQKVDSQYHLTPYQKQKAIQARERQFGNSKLYKKPQQRFPTQLKRRPIQRSYFTAQKSKTKVSDAVQPLPPGEQRVDIMDLTEKDLQNLQSIKSDKVRLGLYPDTYQAKNRSRYYDRYNRDNTKDNEDDTFGHRRDRERDRRSSRHRRSSRSKSRSRRRRRSVSRRRSRRSSRDRRHSSRKRDRDSRHRDRSSKKETKTLESDNYGENEYYDKNQKSRDNLYRKKNFSKRYDRYFKEKEEGEKQHPPVTTKKEKNYEPQFLYKDSEGNIIAHNTYNSKENPMRKYDRYFANPSNTTETLKIQDLAQMQSDVIKNMNAVEIPGVFTSGLVKGDKWDNYEPTKKDTPVLDKVLKALPEEFKEKYVVAPLSKSPSEKRTLKTSKPSPVKPVIRPNFEKGYPTEPKNELKRFEVVVSKSQEKTGEKKSSKLRSNHKSSKKGSRTRSVEKMKSIRKFSNSSENEVKEKKDRKKKSESRKKERSRSLHRSRRFEKTRSSRQRENDRHRSIRNEKSRRRRLIPSPRDRNIPRSQRTSSPAFDFKRKPDIQRKKKPAPISSASIEREKKLNEERDAYWKEQCGQMANCNLDQLKEEKMYRNYEHANPEERKTIEAHRDGKLEKMFSFKTDLYGKKGVNILKNIPNKILDANEFGENLAQLPHTVNGYVPKNENDEKSIDIYKSFRYRQFRKQENVDWDRRINRRQEWIRVDLDMKTQQATTNKLNVERRQQMGIESDIDIAKKKIKEARDRIAMQNKGLAYTEGSKSMRSVRSQSRHQSRRRSVARRRSRSRRGSSRHRRSTTSKMRSDRRRSKSSSKRENDFAPPRALYSKKVKPKPKERSPSPLNFDDEIGVDGDVPPKVYTAAELQYNARQKTRYIDRARQRCFEDMVIPPKRNPGDPNTQERQKQIELNIINYEKRMESAKAKSESRERRRRLQRKNKVKTRPVFTEEPDEVPQQQEQVKDQSEFYDPLQSTQQFANANTAPATEQYDPLQSTKETYDPFSSQAT